MSPRKDLIAFVDLETTGSHHIADEVIEVGLAVYTWPEFKEDFGANYVICPSGHAMKRLMDNDIVRTMHEGNGLLDDIANHVGFAYPAEADIAIAHDLGRYGSSNSAHIPLAGSGVSHFDRSFIRKWFPMFDHRLTYWAYDVGVMRRMFELAGLPCTDAQVKTHRALDDARYHAEEFAWYMQAIRTLRLEDLANIEYTQAA